MDHLRYLCLVFVMLSRLFIAALWSPVGKELTSWLLFVVSYCDFGTLSCGILGQMLYLIVLTPFLCRLFTMTFICHNHRPQTNPLHHKEKIFENRQTKSQT